MSFLRPHGERRVPSWLWHRWLLLSILLFALAIRLLFVLSPGHGSDLGINQGWALSAARLGVVQSFQEQLNGNMLPNHGPLSIVAFAAVGWVNDALPQVFARHHLLLHAVLKVPSIIADVVTCLLLYILLRRARGRNAGLLAALVYAVHPAVIYESAVWGQTDSLFTVFVVAALLSFSASQWILTGALFALAALFKPHAFLFLPLFIALSIRRPLQLLTAVVAGLIISIAVLFPFFLGGSGNQVMNVYLRSVGYYPNLTMGAYNFWWSLFADAANEKSAADLLFGVIEYRFVGVLLYLFFSLLIILTFRKHLCARGREVGNPFVLFGVAGLIAYAFFNFNAEMHERYLFPAMALGVPLLFLSARLATVYVLSSLFFLMNLLGILPYTFIDRRLFGEFPTLDVFIASAHVFLFFLTWYFLAEYRRMEKSAVPLPAKHMRWLTSLLRSSENARRELTSRGNQHDER